MTYLEDLKSPKFKEELIGKPQIAKMKSLKLQTKAYAVGWKISAGVKKAFIDM